MVAWPDVVTIPNLSHSQRFVPSGFAASSITLLNPNDGIVYVARDRDCLNTTPGAWDWKVPSQSYAHLPGQFRSVGLFYVDRSGSGLPGEINTYATDIKIEVPSFFAIGRAQVSIVTSLDIGQGPPPQPPAANNVRLWADVNGDLHVTLPGGASYKVIDDNDPLGGVLTGTLLNPGMAAGVAATNVGALGGVLGGTLPNPGLANNSVNTANVIDGSIVEAKLAKPSVSTPELVDQSVTLAKIANHAVSRIFKQTFSAVISTSSAGFVGSGDVINWTGLTATSDLLVWYQGNFADTVANALSQFFIGWNGGALNSPLFLQDGAANNIMNLSVLAYIPGATHGGVGGQIGMSWATNAGVLSSSWPRDLIVLELAK